jgi:hypothetical protein
MLELVDPVPAPGIPEHAQIQIRVLELVEVRRLNRLRPGACIIFEYPRVDLEVLEGSLDGAPFRRQFLHPRTDEDSQSAVVHVRSVRWKCSGKPRAVGIIRRHPTKTEPGRR